jgi:hypothetical protein
MVGGVIKSPNQINAVTIGPDLITDGWAKYRIVLDQQNAHYVPCVVPGIFHKPFSDLYGLQQPEDKKTSRSGCRKV